MEFNLESLVELKTKNDGNCFFHAVFGDIHSDVFQTDRANEMRLEWYNFLCQFTDLNDDCMPHFLKAQLKKIFNIFFISVVRPNLEDSLVSLGSICKLVNEGKRTIEEAKTKAEKLVLTILEKCLDDVDLLNTVFHITHEAKYTDTHVAGIPKIDYLLDDLNRQLFKKEIKHNLETCALRYLGISEEQYNKEYNVEYIANSLFESHMFYQGYLEAIQSHSYFVLLEEIPILASLANIEVLVCCKDLEGKNKFELFQPNGELFHFRTNYSWTEKKKETVIHKIPAHFARAQLCSLETQASVELSLSSVDCTSPVCDTNNPESVCHVGKQSHMNIGLQEINFLNDDDLEDLPDPSSFMGHNFTSKQSDQNCISSFHLFEDHHTSNLSITSTYKDSHSLEPNPLLLGLQQPYDVVSGNLTTSLFSPGSESNCMNFLEQNLLEESEFLEVASPSYYQLCKHDFASKPNQVSIEINKKTGMFYLGALDSENKMSGTGKLCSKDKKQFVDGVWNNGRLIKMNDCQFKYSSNGDIILFARIYGQDSLLTLDEDSYVARVNIGYFGGLDFNNPNVTFRDIQRMIFSQIAILKVLDDEKSSIQEGLFANFKQLIQERSMETAYYLEYAEDLVQFHKTLENIQNNNISILRDLLSNKNISAELNTKTKCLFDAEMSLLTRNRTLFQTNMASKQYYSHVQYPLKDMKHIYEEGIEHHKNALLSKCNSNAFLHIVSSSLLKLSGIELLCISSQDMQLFSDLINTTNEETHQSNTKAELASLLLQFVIYLWNILIKGLKNDKLKVFFVRQVAPLTNPIYLGLYKSFVDLLSEICIKSNSSAKDVLIKKDENWTLADITWSTPSHKHYFLERQLRFIFMLIEHFKPCWYSNRKKLDYHLKLLRDERSMLSKMKDFFAGNKLARPSITDGLSEEQLVWLFILDDAMASVIQHHKDDLKLCKESKEQMTNFVLLLLTAYVDFITLKTNQLESFRVAAHNVIKFVAQVSPYFVKVSEGDLDYTILLKQIAFIKVTLSQQVSELSGCFPSLISVFSAYWDCKEYVVSHLSQILPYESFKSDVEEICNKILEIVITALDQTVEPKVLVNFFRMFNELLKLLLAVEFQWIVKEDSHFHELASQVLESVDADKKSFLVLEPKEFIKDCNCRAKSIPRHYLMEVIKELFVTVASSLEKTDLDIATNMHATSKLLIAIGHSFIHFKDQPNYVDFDQFLSDCTKPFNKVLDNRSSYQDFDKRLDNIETFYLYTRIQDEIDITKALNLFDLEAEAMERSGFNTIYNKEILQSCYEKYKCQFDSYIEKTGNDENNIHTIIKDVDNMLKLAKFDDMNRWIPDFKQNTIPIILAGLSAVWSIRNSKDITTTGKSLKPHCIQILCILRLLSVDKKANGVEKHLAQVLTGQGKSVVLGLLSTILALLDIPVRVVCYSDYLATRDKQSFKDFFAQFEVSEKIEFGTFEDMANEILSCKIDGTKRGIQTLVKKVLCNELVKQNDKSKTPSIPPSRGVLLIDEVDVFFSDRFYGNTYNGCARVKMQALLEIQTEIWKTVSSGIHKPDAVFKIIDGLVKQIVRNNHDEEFSKFVSSTEFVLKRHLYMMINNAINVATKSNRGYFIRDYKLLDDGKISCRNEDGIYSLNLYFQYYNVFNYFRLKGNDYDHKNFHNFGYLQIGCGEIAYANLPKVYSIISGVSGTLTTLNDPEKEAIKSYGVQNISCMPSFFGRNKLVFDEIENFTIEDFEGNWLTTIYNHVSATIQSGRSVLVFFDTEIILTKFNEQFQSNIDCLHILTGNEELSQLEWIINEAGVAGTVTLATRLMGRGVDFKSNDSSVEAEGGLHVIQTFFSLDEKEEVQIKGRTARKTNNGSYELILCITHLKKDILDISLSSSYQDLNQKRNTIAETKGKVNCERIKLSQAKHDRTMEFLKSFSEYTPDKRDSFLRHPILNTEY